jgi:hypothetical protein
MGCKIIRLLGLLSLVTVSTTACWWRENPEREQKLLMQETIIERQEKEFDRQEKESDDLRRQDYHNKLLRQYE